MQIKPVAFRHPIAPDCLSPSANDYESAQKRVLQSEVNTQLEQLAQKHSELVQAVEAVLRADYVSTLTGSGSFMRHVPPTIQKLRCALTNYRNSEQQIEGSDSEQISKISPRG